MNCCVLFVVLFAVHVAGCCVLFDVVVCCCLSFVYGCCNLLLLFLLLHVDAVVAWCCSHVL